MNSVESKKEEIKNDMVEQLENAIYGLGYSDMFNKELSDKIRDLILQAQCLVEQL